MDNSNTRAISLQIVTIILKFLGHKLQLFIKTIPWCCFYVNNYQMYYNDNDRIKAHFIKIIIINKPTQLFHLMQDLYSSVKFDVM